MGKRPPAWVRHKLKPNASKSSSSRSWWRILVEVAAVIAIPSALLYALGVVVFWLKIANEYDRISIGTTWYAASLVPRSTAAASGIEVMLRGLLYGAFLSVALLLCSHFFAFLRAKRSDRREDIRFFSTPLFVPFSLLIVGLLSVVISLQFSQGSTYGLLFYLRAAAITVGILGLLAILPWIFGGRTAYRDPRLPLRLYSGPAYRGIAVVVVVCVFGSVLIPGEASLSCLWKEDPNGEIYEANVANTQSENEPLQWTLQGGFLTKSDGTWYVLTEADRIQAMSNDESIRVVGGDFSIRYLKVGNEGTPVGEPVPEDEREETGQPYVAVKYCSGFPSQPTVYDLGNTEIYESNYFQTVPEAEGE